MSRHPSLKYVLAHNAAFEAARLIGYSLADAREYATKVAQREHPGENSADMLHAHNRTDTRRTVTSDKGA